MFDIGFAELLIIGIVALLVLGPERLPVAVRTVAVLLGRVKRQVGDIRREIESELDIDGIRRELRNENVLAQLKKEGKELQQTVDDTRRDFQDAAAEIPRVIETASGNKPEQ